MKISNSKERIRQLMDEFKLNQTDFCKKTGIQKSALSNYLNGDRVPRQDQVSRIADAFNISASWLMGYDVPMQEASPAASSPSSTSDAMKAELDRIYHSFNEEGKQKLVGYARDLDSTGLYREENRSRTNAG